jgi:hypothetical protein
VTRPARRILEETSLAATKARGFEPKLEPEGGHASDA